MGKYSDITIDWVSEVRAIVGYGLQARRMLKPLIDGGANIKLIPDEDYLQPFMKIDDPYWNKQIEVSKNKPDSNIRISYALPNRFKINPNAFNIGYAMWETDEYPREWAKIINNNCNLFFAGCKSLVNSALKAGIDIPVLPMNATLDINEWNPEGRIITINELPKDCVKFLFIGNFIPRKNLEELVIGFNCAFDKQKDVALIIKTWSGANNGEGKNHICEAIRHMHAKTNGIDRPKISIITDILDESQIIDLIRSCDGYVSVSNGEGFDLPMVQAMSMEKMIISTRFLAHEDYLDDSNSVNVPFTLMPCVNAQAPLYDAYQMWSRPDMKGYIEALRTAYGHVRSGQSKIMGKNGRLTIKNNFDTDINTDKLANVIRDINNGKYKKVEKTSKILTKELV